MASKTVQTRAFSLRAFAVLCALLSLCVSDNVGPRLLPLPPTPERASATEMSERGQAASHTPSQSRTEGARVEMISAPQSRAGAERQSPLVAAHAPKFELAAPSALRSLRREFYPPFNESSAPFSRPQGRAPPRLV